MRLSLWLALLFGVVSLLSLSATYYVVSGAQENAIRVSLVQDMAGFRAAPSALALARLVRAETAETDPNRRLLSYRLPTGVIAGNAAVTQDAEGFQAVILGVSSGQVTGTFISLTELINGGLMTVALTAQPLEGLRKIFLRVFLFSLLPTCIAALSGGFFLARRASKHLTLIENTLVHLTSGDLSARVADSGTTSDLSRIGARVNRMAEAQEKSMSALKQISADIAHDLKSPIQRVAVLLSDLRDTDDLPAEAANLAKRAGDEIQSIVNTFQSLLQIAQVEGGSPRAGFAPVDLGELAATFVDIYQPAAEEQGRQLCLITADTPVMISGDKTLLGQMLANLIENALRHTPTGTDIQVIVASEAKTARLSVQDQGPGIPADQRQNVLRRLCRLETSRTTPGSGLGLSLVAAIADLHDADLTLHSADPGLIAEIVFSKP